MSHADSATICRHHTLSRNSVAHVQRCTECACVSVHIGPVTLRLDENSLEKLWIALGEASAKLHAQRVERSVHSPAQLA